MNAMVARLPAEVFEFYRRHPSVLVLAGEQTNATDPEIATDFDNVIDLVSAGFAVHRGMLNANQLAAVDRPIGSNPRLVLWRAERHFVLFRVKR